MNRLRISADGYRRITLAALVALGFIIVTGASVRLTDSGLGCPEWPTCEQGSIVPRGATGVHGMVEFVNRTITGLVSIAVILAVLGSLARVPRRRDLTRWSLGLVVGVAAQAVLGGIVVKDGLSPRSVISHFLLSMVLVWNAVVLLRRAGQPDVGVARRLATDQFRTLSRLMLAVAAVVLVTGTIVTGSGPHGGDVEADRLDLLVSDVARIHSIAVLLFCAMVICLVVLARRGDADPSVERLGRRLLLVVVAQAALGYTQYFTGVPELLVGFHVLGAVLVWWAALTFHLGLVEVAATGAPDRIATLADLPA